jgi:predicted amidohydrolase
VSRLITRTHRHADNFLVSVGGYPRQWGFKCNLGDASDSSREEFVRYFQGAVDLPGPALTEIEAISKEFGIFIVVGVIERVVGTLYCTVIFVDPTEGYLGKHRKIKPTASERLVWGQGGADTLPLLEKSFTTTSNGTATAKLGAIICWLI